MRNVVLCSAALLLSSTFVWGSQADLLSNNPFLPPSWGKEVQPSGKTSSSRPSSALGRELEFRGYIVIDGVPYFSIFDKTQNRGQWYLVDEGSERFDVVRFNSRKPSVTVQSGNHVEELELESADGRPIPVMKGDMGSHVANQEHRGASTLPAPTPPRSGLSNFTPPPPPQNLIGKMAAQRNKSKTTINGGAAGSALPSGVSGSRSTRSGLDTNSPAASSSSVPDAAPSSAPPSAAPPSVPPSYTPPSAPPNYIPPPPPGYAPSGLPPTSPNYSP